MDANGENSTRASNQTKSLATQLDMSILTSAVSNCDCSIERGAGAVPMAAVSSFIASDETPRFGLVNPIWSADR